MSPTPPILTTRRTLMRLALAGLALVPALAIAQGTSDRPIRLLVGFSPGGGVDAVARLVAPALAAQLGQNVIVENRTGAAGQIAADAVAKAPPDGQLLLVGESGLLIAQHLQARLPFDPIKSFTPVAAMFKMPLMIVTGNDFPARTPKEFVATLKASPGKYSFATSGVGTVQHLGFEMLKGQTGSFVVHIPYRGAAQIVPDVIGGQVPIGVVSATAGLAQARAGKLRGLAVMSPIKLEGAEDIPALADALPGFDAAPRIYLMAPAGTPAATVERLGKAVGQALANAELARAASAQGALPAFVGPQAIAADLARESAEWGRVIAAQNIRAQ